MLLSLVLRLPGQTLQALAVRMTMGVFALLKAHGQHIPNARMWTSILSLLTPFRHHYATGT